MDRWLLPTVALGNEGFNIITNLVGPPLLEALGGHTPGGGTEALSLKVPAQQVVEAGGSVQVECRVSLGPLQDRAVKTLRVRMRDYFFSISGARGGKGCSVASFMAAAMLAAACLYFNIS
ncbi:uncharacterized protein LOC108669677 [Hyalella azteca]|uniref:Uncharacterized protein LOC108669677 n=1 Tax=Hyalella azteca TaxID=294128 RepID=A0A8B7NG18_HYAAZ|nr:uncharacterized protein LOC108669677 [Hyalella azteca]